MRRLTTQFLIDEVRSLIDETNTESIQDVRDIVPALNRAQDTVADILAKKYEVPLLANFTQTVTTQDIPIPEDAFEQSIQKVECRVGNTFMEIPRIDYRKATNLEYRGGAVQIPACYAIWNKFIRFYPAPNGVYPLRIWYLKDIPPLDIEQGNITSLNVNSNYVIVSDLGDALSPEVNSLSSYVTIVDGTTGVPKVNLQIQYIDGNRIQFRTTPARSSVLGFDISGAISSTVELDDFICPLGSSCIAFVNKPLSNYIVQFAVAELRNTKLGEDSGPINKELKAQMESQCRTLAENQETFLAVTLRNARYRRQYTRSRYRR